MYDKDHLKLCEREPRENYSAFIQHGYKWYNYEIHF